MKVLVTGGVRSGKSVHAESLLANSLTGHVTHGTQVTYVAPGPTIAEDTDPDWAERIRAHQAARPAGWRTLETRDLAAALATPVPVIVDCLGTWLTALLDERKLWEAPSVDVTATVAAEVDRAAGVLDERDDPDDLTVLVTNEVGLGVIPAHRSGRLFRDALGLVNQRFAAHCDEVHLVIAGRILKL